MNKPKKTVLIVDDDADTRASVRLAVEEQDYLDIDVTESSDVTSGLEQLEKLGPDIVILDLHMPGKNGFDFMDMLHKTKHSDKTKVIMLSVDDTLNNIFVGEGKGIDAHYFLAKPFNISDLQALVISLCLPLRA